MLNLQAVVFAALPIIGVWGIASLISIALDRNEWLDWVFIPVFIGMTVMAGHLAWICGIERMLPASRIAEIEDLDDELRQALGARRY
ncbi:hypothetical protein SAMN05428985_11348 [Nocardioides sp. YR527]|uniref:hypothetical protein n=1 Tax=Nocardioides sp. YR527 TaxID=1881028 RepID=UPI00088B863A|nr:hypothetical protein [Nocardioides sp. YR527]SDL29128.1 hypothetical protein SAMN05428985_11348 [Nocardioides sp. YR527]